jgi:hypothetical protein
VGPAARRAAYDAFVASLATRARPVTIVAKSAVSHQRVVDRFLRAMSLGGQARYLTEFVTTLGHTIYVPDGWEAWDPGSALAVLRHELVHVEQFERWGWGGMVLFYGFFPLPIGLAYARARLELEAYRVTIEATAEIDGIEAATSDTLRAFIVARFVGPDYLWMWPFRGAVDGWVRAIQDEVRAAHS